MPKFIAFLLLLTFFGFTSSSFDSRSLVSPHPRPIESFLPIPQLKNARSCSYTVMIKTSCSSVSLTRDKISIAFGDSYHNEVYVKRLDDPYSRTFERCSSDTYQITGPCMHNVCYLYLLRRGSDGWKPESVKIYGSYIGTVKYYYNVFLPNGVWYGFNECYGASSSSSSIPVTGSAAAM